MCVYPPSDFSPITVSLSKLSLRLACPHSFHLSIRPCPPLLPFYFYSSIFPPVLSLLPSSNQPLHGGRMILSFSRPPILVTSCPPPPSSYAFLLSLLPHPIEGIHHSFQAGRSGLRPCLTLQEFKYQPHASCCTSPHCSQLYHASGTTTFLTPSLISSLNSLPFFKMVKSIIA